MFSGLPLAGNALLGLCAAALWGMGDFSGGMGVRRAGGSVTAALRVILLSHAISFSLLLALAFGRGDQVPHGPSLLWGLAAGFLGATSLAAFYIALSRGAMGTSAAVSGLLAATIPALVAMFGEGAPGWRHGLGFLVAGAAIWLIGSSPSTSPSTKQDRATLALAIVAGAGFGCYFVTLKYAGAGGVVWPLAIARVGSLSTCALLLVGLALRGVLERVSITRAVIGWAFSTAILDSGGNLLFLAATRAGRLDIAAVLASLYPASTILLAAAVLGERPTKRQGWGMTVAAVAVVTIAA